MTKKIRVTVKNKKKCVSIKCLSTTKSINEVREGNYFCIRIDEVLREIVI